MRDSARPLLRDEGRRSDCFFVVLSVKSPSDSELWGVNMSQTENPVVPFAPTDKGTSSNGDDRLDKAGQSILHLLHKAAGIAEQDTRHAQDVAQKLSHQLRVAQDRIAELEAEVETYQGQAERAEQWLHKVYTEIEDRFLRQDKRRSGTR